MENKSLLTLVNIKKDYQLGNSQDVVHALKGISINFRYNEFVSILGPSGCGKTTLLNIIGGLDKYTDGDLIIEGLSTKKYKDRDWDIYRNHRIGFIFQSYNLIPHQTILENVELALTIAGLSKKERVEKARQVIDRVGLAGLYNKRPNQLSGGQCQRVAIARALVNEPDILLADEPTGALDTKTSKQIMDLIKEISNEKLVIMVTHNPDIANEYSTRIINLLDGNIINDSDPYEATVIEVDKNEITEKQKAKMSFMTAFRLSLRNLLSKLKRTILVCVAGSIGIVGVSTVLAISAGVHNYIDSIQDDLLSGNPITITQDALDLQGMLSDTSDLEKAEIIQEAGYVKVNSYIEGIIKRANAFNSYQIKNDINQDYLDYLNEMPKSAYNSILIDYGLDLTNNIYTDWKYTQNSEKETMSLSSIITMYTEVLKNTEFGDYSGYVGQVVDNIRLAPDNNDYILSQYDVLDGKIANNKDEIMLVVNRNRQLNDIVLAQLGYYSQEEFLNLVFKAANTENYKQEADKEKFSYSELLGKSFTYYPNDVIFNKSSSPLNPFTYNPYVEDTFKDGVSLKVVGILQPKEDISYGCLTSGLYFTKQLSDYIQSINKNSEIVNYMNENDLDTISSGKFTYTDPNTNQTVNINSGIIYYYDYYFEGVKYTNKVGFVGKTSMYSAFYQMMSQYFGGEGQTNGSSEIYSISLNHLGGSDIPTMISIYPVSFNEKYLVTEYLDKWNGKDDLTVKGKVLKADERNNIKYTDTLEIIISMINTMINIVTYALIAFTALSLLVSTVMIGIITYVSVVERVKEIGVIRSLGGRKRDVSHLFNAETFIIGLISGVFGILFTLFLSVIINLIIGHVAGIYTIAALRLKDAIIMIIVSIILTLISGLIPAKAAANKNPVDALRTE